MRLITLLQKIGESKICTFLIVLFLLFSFQYGYAQCACLNSPANKLLNGSFETAAGVPSTTNWTRSGGGSFSSHSGIGSDAFQVCGNWYGLISGVSSVTTVYQDVTGIPVGDLVSFTIYAGVLQPAIGCLPTLKMLFYNGTTLITGSTVSITVTRNLSITPTLFQYNLVQVVPTGTTKIRVQGSVTCDYLKMDAACLTSAPGSPTPIKLSSFNVYKQNKKVNLNWQTSTEVNSNYFDVQFSKNGTDWQSIGIVNAAGNSSTTQNYSFIHDLPVDGINYYRLLQFDKNAKYEISLIRTISFSTNEGITILPNPTTSRVFINSNKGGAVKSVTLYSATGRVLKNVNNFDLGGSFDMSSYAPGVYMFRIVDNNDKSEIKRVLKQ